MISSAYRQYLGSADGEVFEYHPDHMSDAGQPIPCYWGSKNLDFSDQHPGLSEQWKTIRGVKLIYKDLDATSVTLYVSNDDGTAWVGRTRDMGTGDGQIKEEHFHFWMTGKHFRFKIEHSSTEHRFQWIRMDVDIMSQAQFFEVNP